MYTLDHGELPGGFFDATRPGQALQPLTNA
jgi:hypothetical protein